MNADARFAVLFVCTGNICRSPLAEQLLRRSINTPEIITYSAGTSAVVGHSMPDTQQTIAKELGIDAPDEHVGQQLTTEHIEGADLILVMERAHRSIVVRQAPRALRRTFTFRELARISEVVSDDDLVFETESLVDRLKILVEAAAMNRGIAVPLETPEDDDIIDPYKRSKQTYLESRDQLVGALTSVAQYLNRAAV